MKKLFTFAAALLFGLSAWAAEYEWETLDNLGLTFSSSDNAVTVHSTNNGVYESRGLYESANQYGIKIANSANANLDTSYIEISATAQMSALQLGFSTNNTSTKNYVVAFSSATPFSKDAILGQETATAIVKSDTKANGIHTFTLPEGTQSVRVYRKAKINNVDYGDGSTVYMYYVNVTVGAAVVKHTVSYYDGETLLGTEKVIEGELATASNINTTKPHYTFDGWYNEAALATAADFTAAITADKAFYGKWTAEAFNASTSVNIEQGVVDNGKNWNFASAFAVANIAYDAKGNTDELDSLNSTKTANNEPYLGLKLKKKDAYIEVALNSGDALKVKLGAVAADFKVNVDGVESTLATSAANTVYELTATKAEYVRFYIVTDGKTVVFKQIMINEEIAEINQPVAENDVTLATLTLDGVSIEGFNAATKTYTVTLEEGATIPVVAATAHDENATVGTITQATTIPGDASFVVTAANGTTTATYTIHFVLPRAIEYLEAPYETTIPADFELPNWLAGCTVNHNYMGSDTIVAGHHIIRFEKTDTISLYVESCDSVILDLSATGSRTVAIAVNGVEKANSGKFNSNTLKTLAAFIHSEERVIVNIYGVEAGGGINISRIKVTEYINLPTSLDEVAAEKAQKVMINGQLYILKNGVRYNALGSVVE